MFDDFSRFNTTKPIEERDPFVGEGDHEFVVESVLPFSHPTHGPSARVVLRTLRSTSHETGSRVAKVYNYTRPPKFPSYPSDADRLADFVRKASGAPANAPVGGHLEALLRSRVDDQLLRGIVIKARGVKNVSKTEVEKARIENREPRAYVDVFWTSVPQTPDEVRARRAQLDADLVGRAPAATPAAQPQQPAASTTTYGYAQPAAQPQQPAASTTTYGYAQPQQPAAQPAPAMGLLSQLGPQR